MRLPDPGPRYSQSDEARRNREIEMSDRENLKRQQDIELVSGMRLIMSSPNGTRYKITVSNAAAIVVTAI